MAWDTSSVTIGRSTKKADYDRLRMNDQALASGTFTFYGLKTWKAAQVYDAAVKFNAGVTGTCTFRGKVNHFAPVSYEPSVGTLHFLTAPVTIFSTADMGTKNVRSASVASDVPTSTVAIIILSRVGGTGDAYATYYSNASATKAFAISTGQLLGHSIQAILPVVNRKYYYRASTTTVTIFSQILIGYYT